MAFSSPSAPAERIDHEDDQGDYRGVSGFAVAAVIVGLCSVLAFVHALLQLVPLAGVVVATLALRNIAALSPRLIGRKAALVGMTISLVCLISAPIYRAVVRRGLRSEATEVAQEWFNNLRDNRPELAFRLTQFPTTKQARTNTTSDAMPSGMMRDSLGTFVSQVPVSTLLKWGKRARVRTFCNEDVWADHDMEGVRDIYAVTVGDGPTAVSFFIRFGATRSLDPASGDWQWQVTKHEFVAIPSDAMNNNIRD